MRSFSQFGKLKRGFLVAVGLACLSGCRQKSAPAPSPAASASAARPGRLTPELAGQVLAKIGEREITLGEYAETLERMDPFERLRYQSPDRRKLLLTEIIQVELLAEEAKRRGLDQQPETQERLRQMLRDELLRDVRASLPAPADLPEAEVHAYFDAHRDEFKEPERRRVAHIALASEARAKAALAKALSASPAEWGKLVSELSQDPTTSTAALPAPSELAGDLGIVGPPGHARGANPRVPEALRAAVFEIAQVGGVLNRVVEDGGRFHIVRMTGRTEARDRSYPDAERTIRVALVQQRIREREAQLELELKQRFPVSIDEAALARVVVPEPAGASLKPAASAR